MPDIPIFDESGLVAAYEAQVLSEQLAPLFLRRQRLRAKSHPLALYKFRGLLPLKHPDREKRLDQLLQILRSHQLWRSPCKHFNDPFDGKAVFDLPRDEHEGRAGMVALLMRGLDCTHEAATLTVEQALQARGWDALRQGMETEMLSKHEAQRNETVGVLSLCAEINSPLMWAHYASEHRGVCLRFDVAKDLRTFHALEVEYDDTYPTMTNALVETVSRDDLLPFLRKSSHWAYEKEWRLLDPIWKGKPLQFDPKALTGVILGMRIEPDDKDFILKALKAREAATGLHVQVYESHAADREYKVKFRRLRP